MDSSWNPALRPNSDGVIDDQPGQRTPTPTINEVAHSDDRVILRECDSPTGQRTSQPWSGLLAESVQSPLNSSQRHRSNADAAESVADRDEGPEGNDVDLTNPGEGANIENVFIVATEHDAAPATETSQLGNEAELLSTSHAAHDPTFESFLNEPEESNTPLGGKDDFDQAFAVESQNGGDSVPKHFTRTNSFPEVPPLSQSTILPPHALPKSQAENIIEEEEFTDRPQAPAAIVALDRDTDDIWNTSFAENTGEEDEPLFSNVNGVQPQPLSPFQENVQARYEEGLPLVLSGTGSDSVTEPSSMADTNQITRGQEVDGGFFDKSRSLADDASAFRPHHLDRKTTTQVLDSIQYSPHHVTHAASDTQEGEQSLENFMGEGIAVSSETVKSQVLPEKQLEETEPKAKNEDLAELWKAALGEDELLEETDPSVDPSSFFEDDGEGFLEDDQGNDDHIGQPTIATPSQSLQPVYMADGQKQGFSQPDVKSQRTSNAYTPTSASSTQQRGASSYYPSRSQPIRASTGLPNAPSAPNGFVGATPYNIPTNNSSTLSRPSMPQSAQSFADKSKGGYTSPYDLPMDVSRPRKRAQLPSIRPSPETQSPSSQPPPPRSTSMYSGALPPQEPYPAMPSLPRPGSTTSVGLVPPSALKAKPGTGGFFEDLPSSKPRPSSSMGRVVPPTAQPTPPPPLAAQRVPPRQSSYEQPKNQSAPASAQTYQLLPPERMNMYGDSPQQQPIRPSVPVMNSRYSPAPSQTSTVPPPLNRYASSPAGGSRPPSTSALPHQPRTSSPLTQNNIIAPQQPPSASYAPNMTRPISREFDTRSHPDSYLDRVDENARSQYRPEISESPLHSFPPHAAPPSSSPSASSRTIYTPGPDRSSPDEPPTPQETQARDASGLSSGPPRRSQTQSPSAQKPNGPPAMTRVPYQRPASVNNYAPSPSSREGLPGPSRTERPHREQPQMEHYIRPTDGREIDSLERWKGCPIFSFGFGGTIVKTFPQQIPRYAAGQRTPMIKCSPGEVKIEHGKTFTLDESVATFPGPLKGKGKKKEVLDWLHRKVEELETSIPLVRSSGQVLPDPAKCHEERVLLWNIMKVLVEYDGVVEGNSFAEKAVRTVLSPELGQGDAVPVPQNSSNVSLLGISRRGGSTSIPNPVRPEAMEELRKTLLHGDRKLAVWHAVDNRLWAHAILLSSTLDKDLWKQVAQEFVRQEVKTFGENTESLSALYQIFAGNWEESVDELVPPSARAGLQMVSKTTNSGPTKNALDGLDRWRETLTLILSNRTVDDEKAILALGQLLAGYGRTEAAHICYIFAKTPGLFGGPDDPKVSVALLGANHLQSPFDYGRDFESILLTEVHEFARTVLASSSVSTISAHLQSYKLYHAMILAEYGYKSEAQQYCDTIFSTLKSTTKPSPYYHSLLIGALENLQDRLRQAPRDGSGSWISKPSMDKVSGSIWAKFNSYVAGDEDDAASTASGKVHDPAAGPFARVTGDSPTLSRTTSSNDLYNTYSSGTASMQAVPTGNSRYAPAGLYTPRTSLDQPRRSSQDYLKPSANDTLRPALTAQQYTSRPASSAGSNYEPYVSPPQLSSYPPRSESYLPTPPSQPEFVPQAPPVNPSNSSYQQQAYNPTPPPERKADQFQRHSSSGYKPEQTYDQPPSSHEPPAFSYEPESSSHGPPSSYEPTVTSSYEPPTSSFEAPSSSYEPPSYNPPTYDPDVLQTNELGMGETPRKSNLDDEDDFESRAAALRREEKSRKDREADEAFRKAAEADAQKDNQPKLNNKKSWFGPWFSGGKEKSEASNPNAPIKVKLGEANSFYYDEQLKKWVNKKGGNTEAPSAPAPPPPKGPPSRSVSAAGGPPPSSSPVPPVPPLPPGIGAGTPPIRVMSGPTPSAHLASNGPSRTASPAVQQPSGEEPGPSSDLAAPGPPSAPPSRPATGQSGASSIDDLIGVPQARKGGTVRKAKKGRGYVDVMAK
ncbi:MAG: hypothetical protein Q9164_001090 [Protoblastenia rupestris]